MQLTWDHFERFKTRGLDARRAGQWDAARVYFLEAARVMVALSKQATTEPLAEARRATAEKLLDLARDCENAKASHRKPEPASRKSESQSESSEQANDKHASDWIVKEKPKLRFDDVAGLEDVKTDIKLKMLYPFEHPELAERFGIRAGGGILLYGPPGTGKTMLARATAGEIDAAFFVISPADILSKWVGEAEQNVKKLFDEAAQQPRSIVFIDEIEALVPARRDDGSSVMQRVVPQILQSIEGFGKAGKGATMIMGATNVPWQLDPAMLRPGRFDEKIYIPLPDRPARLKLLDIYLGKRPLAEDVRFESLADELDGYSGADIRYISDRAAVIPFMAAAASDSDDDSQHVITSTILQDVIQETPRSVTSAMLKRFDEFAQEK